MKRRARLVPIHVMIEASTITALEALAEREERSFSDVVRRMLRQAVGGDDGRIRDTGLDTAGPVSDDVAAGDHRA